MQKIVNDKGTYFYYPCKGKKRGNIVFIHGFATNSHYHDNYFVKYFEDEYDYYSIQLPGAGYQEWNLNKKPEVHDMALYCVNVIDSLNIDNIILMGHSMGGGLAPRVANLLKSKIKLLISVTPMNSKISPFKIFNYFSFNPKNIKKNFKLQKKLYFDLTKVYKTQEEINKFLNEELKYQMDHRDFFVKLKKSMFSLKNVNIGKANERQISCPTLVIAGKYDKVIPHKSVLKAFKNNKYNKDKDIHFELMQNSAHLPFQEEQLLYVKIIKEFIDSYKNI